MSNDHTARGMQHSSKSRSKRELAARVDHDHRWRSDVAANRRNALKHGIFAVDPTIPGEDFQEFSELYAALVVEWKPSGPTEADDRLQHRRSHVAQEPSTKNASCQVEHAQLLS
jgi:hypothetical protein